VTLDKPPGTRPGADHGTGSFVDVGLKKEVLIDKPLKPGTRVTVRMEGGYETQGRKFLIGRAVPPATPRQELGSYWGYELRLAAGLQVVFAGACLACGLNGLGHNIQDPGRSLEKEQEGRHDKSLLYFVLCF
jgi:predicted SPOUT superfamily RNA methylase MTH1